MGRRHRPFFRINAVEARTPRDGKILEKLGHYDPIEKDPAKQVVLNRERTEYWLDKGAIPSNTVSQILLRLGIKHKYAEQQVARRAKARAIARAKGKPFDNTERIAAKKEAEAIEEKAKAEAEAKAAEEKVEVEAAAEKPPAEPKKAKEGEHIVHYGVLVCGRIDADRNRDRVRHDQCAERESQRERQTVPDDLPIRLFKGKGST